MGMAAMMLISVIGAGLPAQSNPRYTTVLIEYVGKSDRYLSPIIISSSADEAEWYKQKLFSCRISALMGPCLGPGLTEVYIVPEATWAEIADKSLPKADLKRPVSNDGPRRWPGLRLILARGHDFQEVTIDAEESVLMLGEIKKQVSAHPLLVSELSEIEVPMNVYLKQQH